MEILLRGVVGSTAYGLNGPHSDRDTLGVFRAPTRQVLGLSGDAAQKKSYVQKDPLPDSTLHEVSKFVRLCLDNNPTVMELLWLAGYEVSTPAGERLVALRSAFPHTNGVRNAYGGYAIQQARRLLERHERGEVGFSSDVRNRTAKHGRHVARLLHTGTTLLATGELQVSVAHIRDELFEIGELAVADPVAFTALFEERKARLDSVDSVLAERPDRDAANEFLVSLRLEQLWDDPEGTAPGIDLDAIAPPTPDELGAPQPE